MSIPGNWRERQFRYSLGAIIESSGRVRAPLNVERHILEKKEDAELPSEDLVFLPQVLLRELENAQ